MCLKSIILKTLELEVKPAMGCTEPVSVALAVSKARELSGTHIHQHEKVEAIHLHLSPNVFKNALAVGIPGTDQVGIKIAAALGLVSGQSQHGLEIFKSVTPEKLSAANQLIEDGKVHLHIKDTTDKIYIEAWVQSSEGFGHTIIKDRHDAFVLLENDKEKQELSLDTVTSNFDNSIIFKTPLVQLIRTIENMEADDLKPMLTGLEMNKKIANQGLERRLGVGVGHTLYKNMKKNHLEEDLMNLAMTLTASASDARMSGTSLPVMSSNGSGNNGLTALLPLVAYAQLKDVTDEALSKATAISHIVNSVVKNKIGRLSALCGCGVAAGTGAAVALTWLEGGDDAAIHYTVQNMVACTTGMICDGAKIGCALKLSTSVQSAIQSMLLATDGMGVPAGNGIVGRTADETLENLGILSERAMPTVDQVMLDVMLSQAHKI